MPKKMTVPSTDQKATSPVRDDQQSIEDVIPQDGEAIFEIDRESLRRSVKKGRAYVWPPFDPNPKEYISVTTALNVMPKPFLVRWAAKLVAETAVDKINLLNELIEDDPEDAIKWLKGAPWSSRDRAAAMGTEVHLIAELDALGKHAEASEIVSHMKGEQKAKVNHMRHFFRTVPMEVLMVEGVVYDDGLGYAGTFDFIIKLSDPMILGRLPVTAEDGSITVLVDLKTGKGVYSETALQLAAYRHAGSMVNLRSAERTPMMETDAGAVLHVTGDGWKFIPVQCGDTEFATFKKALALAPESELDRDLVGGAALSGKWTPDTHGVKPVDLKGMK